MTAKRIGVSAEKGKKEKTRFTTTHICPSPSSIENFQQGNPQGRPAISTN
jgi:hypothetical protein